MPAARFFIRLGLILIAVGLAAWVALQSTPNVHPDELAHIDAFHYYETAWWPPAVGDARLYYDGYGWSRVFYGETVYWIYGRLATAFGLATPAYTFSTLAQPTFRVYRLLNVALWALTLSLLFFRRSETGYATKVALTMLCIPQILYTFSYANSDAWGISTSIFLFLAALACSRRAPATWTARQAAWIGGLGGLVLSAKTPYLLTILLPAALLAYPALQAWRRKEVPLRGLLAFAALAGLVAGLIAAPLKVIYPLTQPDYEAHRQAVIEARAVEGFKPSNPSNPNLNLAGRGMTPLQMLRTTPWLLMSTASFYGVFGSLNIWGPRWVYALAALCALLLVSITARRVASAWHALSVQDRLIYALSPLVLLANTAAALARSLLVDFQPQGRYFFASLVPIAVLLLGPTLPPTGKLARWQTVLTTGMLLLALVFMIDIALTARW